MDERTRWVVFIDLLECISFFLMGRLGWKLFRVPIDSTGHHPFPRGHRRDTVYGMFTRKYALPDAVNKPVSSENYLVTLICPRSATVELVRSLLAGALWRGDPQMQVGGSMAERMELRINVEINSYGFAVFCFKNSRSVIMGITGFFDV
ncbi:hypothetical protein C1X64_05085 [Pseudomonas sp. GW456-E7]|nr:hypothetical protein C1X64_05085 [Pseudomonas sp. GW456-E7]